MVAGHSFNRCTPFGSYNDFPMSHKKEVMYERTENKRRKKMSCFDSHIFFSSCILSLSYVTQGHWACIYCLLKGKDF